MFVEINIDALVGPTHHFGGLGVGNVASLANQRCVSHPRQAALQGLDKAAWVARLGIPQFLLLPPRRPHPHWLEQLGFSGSFTEQCQAARAQAPLAYSAAFSSAFMWAANAATYTPACDAGDCRNHLTLANLASSWHRESESRERRQQLSQLFAPLQSKTAGHTVIHEALASIVPLRDEGAANHMRLCNADGTKAVHIFVYGQADQPIKPQQTFPRQTLAASQAVARLHGLNPELTFFLQQHPQAIDSGVFHNDVIATSHTNVLLYHELAFLEAEAELERIAQAYQDVCGQALHRICISQQELSLRDAVASYFFNSQLLTPQGRDQEPIAGPILLCAQQCARLPQVRSLIERLVADDRNPITDVHYVDLDESMAGGGGPACLRLRVQLPRELVDLFAPEARWTTARDAQWRSIINQFYPEQLDWECLGDAEALAQYAAAYDALASVSGATL